MHGRLDIGLQPFDIRPDLMLQAVSRTRKLPHPCSENTKNVSSALFPGLTRDLLPSASQCRCVRVYHPTAPDGPNGGAGGGMDGAGQFFPYSPAPRIKLSGFPVAQVRALFSDLRHLCTDLHHRASHLHHLCTDLRRLSLTCTIQGPTCATEGTKKTSRARNKALWCTGDLI